MSVIIDNTIVRISKSSQLTLFDIEFCNANKISINGNTISFSLVSTSRQCTFNALKIFSPELFDGSEKNNAILNNIYSALSTKYKQIQESFDTYARSVFDKYDILEDYQKESAFLLTMRNNNLFSLEQGMGKSLTVIVVSLLLRSMMAKDDRIVLIVCPAVVKHNWIMELTKWGVPKDEITMLDSVKSIVAKKEKYIIVNYRSLKKYLMLLSEKDIFHIIADECHYIKNIKSGRHKSLNSIESILGSKLTLMTGTPITNRVDDLFGYLSVSSHSEGVSYRTFVYRYCKRLNHGRGKIVGVKNEFRLRSMLSNFLIRVSKDKLKGLSDKRYIDFFFKLHNYKKAYNEAMVELSRVMEGKNTSQVNLAIYTVSKILAEAKVGGIAELCRHISSIDGKVVIFGTFRKPIAMLKEKFGDEAVVVAGGMSSKKKNDAINSFLSNDKIKFFIGQYTAAGIGINLVNSQNVVLMDVPLTPDIIDQAVDRLHRKGQTGVVKVYKTICENSLDEVLTKLVNRKRSDSSLVIDGKKLLIDSSSLDIDEIIKYVGEKSKKDIKIKSIELEVQS